MITFFDTETTGLPSRFAGIGSASQPHIVQLAAYLTEDDGKVVSSCNFIVQPDGYSIPKEASDVHGISTEMAKACGIPLVIALSAFSNFVKASSLVVAHNIKFDAEMIAHEMHRLEKPDRLAKANKFCTMEKMKPIMKLPGSERMQAAGIKGFKPPRMQEAFKFAFGREFDGAHDAFCDVNACKDVFFWLKENGNGQPVS